ncbi:MAG TPA: ATP-binding protein [Solirubrobacteraceae bacterium]|nr:ATP-binding protein [Solirubrobacteraceae bacterium]
MRAPIAFVYGNCVFASGLDDGWAAFRVQTSAYAWSSDSEKRSRLVGLVGALETLGADLQVLRVSRTWGLRRYEEEMGARAPGAAGSAGGPPRARERYVREQARRLEGTEPSHAVVFILASLREPERDVASFLSGVATRHPRTIVEEVRRALSPRARRLMSVEELERARAAADRIHARIADFLDVRPARMVELQWLIRRGFCRGVGEPHVDGLHEPRALAFECNGKAVLAPLEGDVMRWSDCIVEHRGRALVVESELGRSWQAQLVLGALPERVDFPGARAELMFAPVEGLPFAIDLSLNARFLPNELAIRIARRRVQDADQIVRAESEGEQGASDLGLERTQEARDLLSYLQASSRPPLLRATVAIAVGAPTEPELERRVEMCRRAYGEVRLHRPLGDQLQLFLQQLPGQRTRLAGYDDTLTTEQVAAMMPTATHQVGSEGGFYLGHTLTASRQPVRFNIKEGSESDRNTTVLCVGALGTGKTTLAQKLEYEGFLEGARVIDCDPKGDHRFHQLEDVRPHVELLTLRPDPTLRGMLDPLRIAPSHLRQDLTVSFLHDLLPGRAEPTWETAVVAAVDRVITRARKPTCWEVVGALRDGDETDRRVAKALEVYARSGLTQLGFANPDVTLPAVGRRQVTYLPIRDLPTPEAGVRRAEYSQSERVGQQIVRLIAIFAMHLMSAERERLKLFCFDEGWRLLGDPVGRTLLSSLQRMGRSELAVPIISTQLVTDALVGEGSSIENLLGATFVFGMRSEAEAARALALLGLDPEDAGMRQSLLSFESGSCLMRDHRGRIEAVQVDLVLPKLRRAFSTTPTPA